MRYRNVSLAMAFLALATGRATAAYQAMCGTSGPTPVPNATIISAFAEPRPVDGITQINVRFHSGVDISECNAGKEVYPILAGTRETPTVCTGNTCVRIRDSSGRAFDYEHLQLNLSLPATGQFISTTTRLGNVLTGNTLHLQEAQSLPGAGFYRLNPQRANALSFNTGDFAQFTQTSITGANNQSIILLPKYTSQAEGLQPNPTSFEFRNGVYYAKGVVSVLLAASGGSSRKGVYAAGFALSPSARTRAILST